jgi:hypothetical protein
VADQAPSQLPWWVINLGVMDKSDDCEAVDTNHHWYNIDWSSSGCYHLQSYPAGAALVERGRVNK